VTDGLNRVLRTIGAPPAGVLASLFAHWPTIAGAELAEHCRPVRVVNRRLIVEVDDSAWAARVRLSEAKLLERLASRLGEGKVDTIRPRVARKTGWERSRRR
jgi:predicted nucleic acid-binding Zn ribbon protein